MKTKTCTLIIFFNFLCLFSFSQGEYIVEINRTTGVYTNTGPLILNVTLTYADDRTIDENTGTFFFQSAIPLNRLYSINELNDSVLNFRVLDNNVQSFQFDNASNVLYGIKINDGLKHFGSLNPVTGTFTYIGSPLPGSDMYSGSFSTFNKTNHTYIYLNPPNTLLSINAPTGSTIESPALMTVAGEHIVNFSFDDSTNTLYGLLQDSTAGKYFLVTIDPTTGNYSRVGPGTICGMGGGSATIDEATQQYIYLYSDAIGYKVATLDIATGDSVYNPLLEAFHGDDNFNSLKYDNVNGKLYALHWEASTIGIKEHDNLTEIVTVYPNPFSQSATVKFNNPGKENYTLTLLDLQGHIVRTLTNITTDKVDIDRKNLSSGLYFLQLRTDKEIIATLKLSID